MFRHCLLLIFFPFLLFLASCSGDGSSIGLLAEAESVMEQHPDSALEILSRLSPTEIKSDKHIAKYNLLTVQAKVKNNINIDSDTMIDFARNYYMSAGSDRDRMKADFYYGYVNHQLGNLNTAITSAMSAYDLAHELEDSYWIAKAAELIADIYCATYNDQEAVKYTKEAIEHYEKAGKILNHRFALYDLGLGYGNLKRCSDGIAILDSITKLPCESSGDSALRVYSYRTMIPIYIWAKQYDKASEIFEILKGLGDDFSQTPRGMAYLSDLEMTSGDKEPVVLKIDTRSLLSSHVSEKMAVYLEYERYYRAKGMLREQISALDSILELQNDALEEVIRQSVMTSQRDYYLNKAEKEQAKSQRLIYLVVLCIVVFAVVVSGGYFAYRLRMRTKSVEIDEKMNRILVLSNQLVAGIRENDGLSKSLSVKEQDIQSLHDRIEKQNEAIALLNDRLSAEKSSDEMATTIENLFKERWSLLNSLCNEYFEDHDSEISRKIIYNNVESEINKMRDKKSLRDIEDAVNKYMGNIVADLKKECSFLKPEDIVFITYIYAGFSPRAICQFTDIKLKYFYNKKARLKTRILNSKVGDCMRFVDKLG